MATKGYVLQDSNDDITNVSNILATVDSIDLKATGQTTLYTVPSQKKLVIQDILVMITDDDSASVAAVVRVGKSAAYNEYTDNITLTSMFNAGSYTFLSPTGGSIALRKVMSNGDVVALDVTTGATATTLTASVSVIGYLTD